MPPQDSIRRGAQAKRRRLARRVPRNPNVQRAGWVGGLLLGENVVRTPRITEEGNTRLTEDGEQREVEGGDNE